MNFKIPAIGKAIFSTVIEVRISDINYGQHLGHDSLVSYLHEARLRFLKKLGYSELDIEGLGILVTQLVVNYLAEAFYADKLVIQIEMASTSKTSLQLIYQAFEQDSNKEIARAVTTVTFFDYHKSKVARIPAAFSELVGNIGK